MMIGWMLIFALILAPVTMGRAADAGRISKGDTLKEVHSRLGTPGVEYPLNGKLVLEYAHCTIVSSNGTVISASYKQPVNPGEKGDGSTEEDAPPTIEETRDSAMQGDAESQYLLAYCFQFGKAVDQDYDKAIAWYRKAAQQGHMAAQHNLGYLHMIGRGVDQDYVEAYMWALLAADNGNDTLKNALDHRLSEEQQRAGTMRAEHMRLQMQARESD